MSDIPTGHDTLPERESFVLHVGRLFQQDGAGLYDSATQALAIVTQTDNPRPEEKPRQLRNTELVQAAAFRIGGVSCRVSFADGLPEELHAENLAMIREAKDKGSYRPLNLWGAVIVTAFNNTPEDVQDVMDRISHEIETAAIPPVIPLS